ncbi:Arginyl-tRNA synthetase [Haplosporangium bisporale]|nr:Arginyl-tRNA synthetase [Haplosporangium bisporale]
MVPTLLQFRTAIATHLGRVLGEPADSLLPLVQQDTAHRKAGHAVFSVVIKRLPGGDKLDEEQIQHCVDELSEDARQYVCNARRVKDMLLFDPAPGQLIRLAIQDTHKLFTSDTVAGSVALLGKRGRETDRIVVVNGLSLQQDENGYCALRRSVVVGFISRLVGSKGLIKVFCERSDGDEAINGLFCGLDLESADQDTTSVKTHLQTIEETIKTSKEIKFISKDGSWLVQLSPKSGQVKIYTPSTTATATSTSDQGPVGPMGMPTPLVQTLALIANHFSKYDALDRYIWVVPDGRRLFAEQLLELAKMVYSPREVEDGQERTKKQGWPDLVEVVVFGPAGAGKDKTDMPFSDTDNTPARMARIMEYAKAEMSKIIVENRGGSLHNDYEDGDFEEDQVILDEEALSRMATILAHSAVVVACAGTRRLKKLNMNMKQLLDGKGNSGVFLQIERKSGTRLNPEANLSLLHPYPEAFHLALVIAEWADIHDTLTRSLDPYPLVNYLFHLAAEIGQANRVFRVKDMETSVAEARWLLFWCAKRVLEHGLMLLGLKSVERM